MGIRLEVFVVQYYKPGGHGQAGYSHFCSDCYEEASQFAQEQNVPLLRYSCPEVVEGIERPAPEAVCQCWACKEWKKATTATLEGNGWRCKECKDKT